MVMTSSPHDRRTRQNLCHMAPGYRWAVLLFNRPPESDRTLADSRAVETHIVHHLRARLGAEGATVDHHESQGRLNATTFASNCAVFAKYDLIVAVHGAALSNLICARPCTRILEMGFNATSMYRPLISQLDLIYCFAEVTRPKAGSNLRQHVVMPQDLRPCLDLLIFPRNAPAHPNPRGVLRGMVDVLRRRAA